MLLRAMCCTGSSPDDDVQLMTPGASGLVKAPASGSWKMGSEPPRVASCRQVPGCAGVQQGFRQIMLGGRCRGGRAQAAWPWESHCWKTLGQSKLQATSAVHVHPVGAEHVHRNRCNETHPQVQSALSADHLVASGGRRSAEHGGRRTQEAMPCAMSCKTEIRPQHGEGRSVWCFGGRKNDRNST